MEVKHCCMVFAGSEVRYQITVVMKGNLSYSVLLSGLIHLSHFSFVHYYAVIVLVDIAHYHVNMRLFRF